MDIKALFEYNWHCRRKFLDSMGKLPWEKLVENREASFNSMRNIFLHSLEAEQGCLRRLAGRIGEWSRHDYDRDFKDVEAMKKYMEEVEAESRAYFAKLGPGDLDKVISWPGRGGSINKVRVEDMLMHVAEEEIHHRGELICLMWQLNATPPYTSYTGYVAETGKEKST